MSLSTYPVTPDLDQAIRLLCLTHPAHVIQLLGGASSLSQENSERLSNLLIDLCTELEGKLLIIDGGTNAGIMAAAGKARQHSKKDFFLLGVASIGTIRTDSIPEQAQLVLLSPPDWNGLTNPDADCTPAPLEAHHSHFMIVPGTHWGAESVWLDAAASFYSTHLPVITLVAGGGSITKQDVSLAKTSSRHIVCLQGTGGMADELQPEAGMSCLQFESALPELRALLLASSNKGQEQC